MDISEPSIHAGGGTAAAVSASLAAATAALVATLSASRKANRDRLADIQRDVEHLAGLQQTLLLAAREDEAVLEDLMSKYRGKAASDDELNAALRRAANSTIGIAISATTICEIAERLAHSASRFTVSDVGAAAALARGATIGALLTAETNIWMLARSGDHDIATIRERREGVEELDRRSQEATQNALRITRERLRA
jgi:formiminotetrahydrofolate cyclodeaminase